MSPRLICVHHRLSGMTGHRFTEALGLLAAARKRGMASLLFISAHADAAVRAALPGARAVLDDPVFRPDLSFDERTRAFIDLLHAHIDPELGHDDRLLLTVATQCEARALTVWLASLPERKRPWTLVLTVSDRWNRYGPAERERQVAEFRTLAADLGAVGNDVRQRLIFTTVTEGLRDELTFLLSTPVLLVAMAINVDTMVPRPDRPARRRPVAGFAGGTRQEKGSHRIPAIIAACRRLGDVDFALQLTNELLSEDTFEELCRLCNEPGIQGVRGPLDYTAYCDMLARLDLVLLPYDRVPYQRRTSSILMEAAVMALPVVVPDHTWMSDQVTAGTAAGIVYEGEDCESIAAAVMRCIADLPVLSARGRARGAYWRQRHGIEPFFDWLECEISSRQAAVSIRSRDAGTTGPL
jgi:glycosyltransferase involved in cell wall biosynthesis